VRLVHVWGGLEPIPEYSGRDDSLHFCWGVLGEEAHTRAARPCLGLEPIQILSVPIRFISGGDCVGRRLTRCDSSMNPSQNNVGRADSFHFCWFCRAKAHPCAARPCLGS
jgi:hypothetical protein